MDRHEVPLWLRVHEKIDMYLSFVKELSARADKRSGLDIRIDEACGVNPQKDLNKLLRHISRLKKLYDRVTSV